MPGCCEFCKIVWAQVFHDVTDLLLGSPAALLRLHRCLLLEALVAVVLLSVQVVVFLAYFRHSEPHDIAVLLCLVLIPMAVTLARVPLLLRMERRCRVLADSFITQNAAVATGLVQLVRGRPSKIVQLISVFLATWYVCCVIWNYVGPPCKDLTEAIEFWKLTPDAVPCETFEASCTLLMLANLLLGGMLTAAPWGVRYFQSHFLPKRSRGIPLQVLEKLPEFVHGASGAPQFSDPDVTCAICIEALQQGDVCRQLPCNHTFHKSCVDSWLVRSATCPMRCPTDLWSLATGKPSTAFDEEPSAGAGDLARAGSSPTSPAAVLGRTGQSEA